MQSNIPLNLCNNEQIRLIQSFSHSSLTSKSIFTSMIQHVNKVLCVQWKKEFCFGRTTISISQSNDGNLLPSKYLEMRNKLQQYKARQDPSKLKNLQIRRSRSQVVWALAAWLIKKKGGGKGKKNDRYLKI